MRPVVTDRRGVVGAARGPAGPDRPPDGEDPTDRDTDGEDEPLPGVAEMGALGQLGRRDRGGVARLDGGLRRHEIEVDRRHLARQLGGELVDVDTPHLGDRQTAVGEFAGAASLRRANGARHLDVPVGGGGGGVPRGTKPRFTSTVTPSSCTSAVTHVVAGDPVLRTVEDDDLLGQPHTGWR